jgi:thioredoxin reductase (NADPH)
MTNPVLMAVDDNPDGLRTLDDTLRRRYERDYLVIGETSPGTALGRIRELRAAGHPVAVLMAAAAMAATPGSEFLAQARSILPAAKRVLVVPRGGPGAPSLRVPVPLVQDRQAAIPVLRAIALGMVDTYLSAPGAGRDEEFHRAVSELLEEWAHDAVPALPAVRIIAHERSARAHELRDTLARNGIPYVFHAAGTGPAVRGGGMGTAVVSTSARPQRPVRAMRVQGMHSWRGGAQAGPSTARPLVMLLTEHCSSCGCSALP